MDIPFTRSMIGRFDVDLFSEFFQGFGAMEVNYYEYADNRLPWPLKGIVDKKAGLG